MRSIPHLAWVVMASAAKQSPAAGALLCRDCFLAALLAMTFGDDGHGPVRNRAAGAALRGQASPQRQRPLPARFHPAPPRLCLCAALPAGVLAAAQTAPGVLAISPGDDAAAAGMATMGVPLRRQRPDGSPMF